MRAAGSVSSAEQNRALGLSTVAFTACFAVWTIFSIIGVEIKKELGLNEFEFGLLVATPVLTGSVIRLVLGVWTERWGGRLVFTLQMLAAAAATFALTWATTYAGYLLAALGVGLAGGSFIIGVAYVSRWYEAGRQGTALGIFGAGNVGAAVTKFLAPFVMVAMGWRGVAEIWAAASIGLMLVVLVGLIYFARHYVVFGLAAMIALFAFIEATFRGRIERMVTSVTIGLAVGGALALMVEFFWPTRAPTGVALASYLLWENLRELWQ